MFASSATIYFPPNYRLDSQNVNILKAKKKHICQRQKSDPERFDISAFKSELKVLSDFMKCLTF